jgi:hypothetical protein
VLGIWNGEGMGREWEGEVSLRATWGQGGQDRITSKEGFQVSKGEWKGELTRNWQGEQEKRYCAIIIMSTCVYVYNNCPNVTNNLNCV